MISRKSLYLTVWILLIAACGVTVFTASALKTDLTQFLPNASDSQQELLLDELREGAASRLLLLELSNGSVQELAKLSHQLASALRRSGHFKEVSNGDTPLNPEVRAELFSYRYLLHDTSFDSHKIGLALRQRLLELTSPLGPPDKHDLPADPTATFRLLMQRWAGESRLHLKDGIWFSQDDQRALMLLRSRYPGFELDRQEQMLNSIHNSFTTIDKPDGLSLAISGPPVFAVETRALIRGEAMRLSIVASVVVALLLWFSYQSLPLLLYVAFPLFSGIAVASTTVIALFGEMHGITLAFGITLIGIAVDYPIHLFSHAQHSGDSRQAINTIWPTLRLGVVTTVLGFSALLFSGFGGLSQLGAFAVAGLIGASLVTRYLLPMIAPNPPHTKAVVMITVPHPRRGVSLLAPLLIVVTLPYLLMQGAGLWEDELARLSPIPEQARQLDRQLKRELGASDSHRLLVLNAGSAEALLQLSEQLELPLLKLQQEKRLEAFDLPSNYLPSHSRQLMRQLNLPKKAYLTQQLAQASEGLPFKTGLFKPFIDAVEASRHLSPISPQALQGTPFGLRLDSLLSQRGNSWRGFIPLRGVSDAESLQGLAKEWGDAVSYLDLSADSSALVSAYRDEALYLSGLGIIGALLVLMQQLPLRRVWRVVTPVAAAMLVTATLLLWFGHPLSLFHIIALLLVMGIGLDYALFIERTPLSHYHFSATAHALLICNITTLVVFGLLAFTEIQVLQAIGQTVAIGALLSLLFSTTMVHNISHDSRQ